MTMEEMSRIFVVIPNEEKAREISGAFRNVFGYVTLTEFTTGRWEAGCDFKGSELNRQQIITLVSNLEKYNIEEHMVNIELRLNTKEFLNIKN